MAILNFKCTIFVLSLCLLFISSSVLTGKHRRALRAVANRLKQDKTLDSLIYKTKQPKETSLLNLNNILNIKEMVLLKLDVEKRKEAKILGLELAVETKSELIQVVGHTVLLYKQSSPPNNISNMLESELKKIELNPSESDNNQEDNDD